MRKEAALPIRLEKDVKQRLQDIADALGITVSNLVRILVKSFVEEFERSGGQCVMPPRWQTSPLSPKSAASKRK
jgi:hypothetical protein